MKGLKGAMQQLHDQVGYGFAPGLLEAAGEIITYDPTQSDPWRSWDAPEAPRPFATYVAPNGAVRNFPTSDHDTVILSMGNPSIVRTIFEAGITDAMRRMRK